MTTKAHRLIPQIFAIIFTMFGVAACSTTASAPVPQTQANELRTVFKCVQQGSDWATIAERGSDIKIPLIIWNTKEFGDNYTPDQRCQIVSERLTKAVAENGGKLALLRLRVGELNNNKVICVTNKGSESCNSENLLFTLNQKNSEKSGDVWQTIFNIGKGDAGVPPVLEKGNASILLENLWQYNKDKDKSI
jgi:hypothetical protein